MGTTGKIIRAECEISQAVVEAQERMFRLAKKNHHLDRQALSLETGIPANTLKSYSEGTMMPLAAFVKIAAVKGFPNELLNLVLDIAEKAIADADADDDDIDDAAVAAVAFLERYVRARHPDSAAGIRIDHTEKPELTIAAAGLVDRASKVASEERD